MYLFDTDVLSNLLKRDPSPRLLRRLAEVPRAHQHTSAITVGELVYGAFRTSRPEYFVERLEARVWSNVVILPFDHAAAHGYGRVRAELERIGRPIGEPDLRIAAIALANRLTIVTGNVRHFAHVPGLAVEDWLLG